MALETTYSNIQKWITVFHIDEDSSHQLLAEPWWHCEPHQPDECWTTVHMKHEVRFLLSDSVSADLSCHAFYLSHPLILPLYQTVSLQLGPLWPWLSSRFSSMCCSIGGREVRCGWTAALSLWAPRVTDWVGRSDDPPPCPTKVKPPRLYSTDTVGDFTDSDYSELSKIQRLLEWRENSLE